MKKKALGLSNDGYYVIFFISESEIGYKRTRINEMYYISFIITLLVSILYVVFRYIFILVLFIIPILIYLLTIAISLHIYKPEIYEKIIRVEMKEKIVKIHTASKTFIIRRGKILGFTD
ncbi:hypothetical protein SULI_01465 [Saccharolobus solfataricus]|uniref:Uncharacterized protein n=2 Tax=Saccharolobus solfataricus TaxID=2287 RepID=A0A0E3JZT5_SACSO|nr:hypothetical protein [Saccharolobus solfataricus]AKA72719.1 hypothetical protein SULB_0289 [Saccharolobus solfataricus]AKA75418.1 hypothetical protein SULC_0287 [Saccharolobus solfataricus]AKA78110.1 hypothetical protein SULA_0287 [Saccharolobus solfataricus]AZF67232.1 hypothetical protein SULG_01465 [Saccharolobus solfataricus]AZF69852.1 hypothetical protein SULH_01465 [Saccharolobus solfataricus]